MLNKSRISYEIFNQVSQHDTGAVDALHGSSDHRVCGYGEDIRQRSAYQVLNYFKEGDSGRLIGDYLLVDEIEPKDLSKVMLQSNSNFSVLLYSMLAWACTDIGENGNWMTKLETQDPYAEYDDAYYRDLALSILDAMSKGQRHIVDSVGLNALLNLRKFS